MTVQPSSGRIALALEGTMKLSFLINNVLALLWGVFLIPSTLAQSEATISVATDCVLPFPNQVPLLLLPISSPKMWQAGPEVLSLATLVDEGQQVGGNLASKHRVRCWRKSRTLPMPPASFSIWTRRMVCSSPSNAFRWRISAAKAALSASGFAREFAESTSMGSPSALIMRGNRLGRLPPH